MSLKRRYILKKIGCVVGILLGFIFLFISLLIMIYLIKNNPHLLFFGLIAFTAFFSTAYLLLKVNVVMWQYIKIETRTWFDLDKKDKVLIKINTSTGKKDYVPNEFITQIELYYPWRYQMYSDTGADKLGYSRFFLKNNTTLVVTQNMIDLNEIKSIYKNKVTYQKRSFVHQIK